MQFLCPMGYRSQAIRDVIRRLADWFDAYDTTAAPVALLLTLTTGLDPRNPLADVGLAARRKGNHQASPRVYAAGIHGRHRLLAGR